MEGICWNSPTIKCPVVDGCRTQVRTQRETIAKSASALTPEKYTAEGGFSNRSKYSYRLSALRTIGAMIKKPLILADRSDVQRIFKALENPKAFRGRTARTYGVVLRSYYSWVHEQVPAFLDPTLGVKLPSGTPSVEREALPEADVKKLLAHIQKYKPMFYEECVMGGNHLMRVNELLPETWDTLKSICPREGPCKGGCTQDHDFQFLPGGTVRFRVKGTPQGEVHKRWSRPETFTPEELDQLRRILKRPSCVAHTATSRLKQYAKGLGISLINEDGQEINVGFHVFARHTASTELSPALNPEELKAAAHVTGKDWASKYVHPRAKTIEDAKKKTVRRLYTTD